MKQTHFTIFLPFLLLFPILLPAQNIPAPNILEVKEDDRIATIYWNSKTDNYHPVYDPWKQMGIYSYRIEWGKVSEGFTHSSLTPYRVIQCQPLESGVLYQARVYALDAFGVQSAPSTTVQFQHDATRVQDMANRLNGFFDDFNLPMGPFDEKKWNQSYSGCAKLGYGSQHINAQYHAHNVLASDACDRGIASSRARADFDFTGRTGVIEFDLDGSKLGRQFWYLDLSPASRKRDLTGHISPFPPTSPSDPPFLLRFAEIGDRVAIDLADEQGRLLALDNIYQNGACGGSTQYCPGENLAPIPNVRKHWRIELSKTAVKVFINDILVADASLVTSYTPNGLPYEVAQVNWLLFSYNTTKENVPLSMLHWDNFGFDAPLGYMPTTVVHNYTDGHLGTDTPRTGNEFSNGMTSTISTPAQSIIPIPDPIQDMSGNNPLKAELMFTIQGGTYSWTANDYITVNGTIYNFPKPTSSVVPALPDDALIDELKPYSAIVNLNPQDLVTGNNQINFHLNDPRILNVHIELTYPSGQEPSFTPPVQIFSDYMQKLMAFRPHADVGPNVIFDQIDGYPIWTEEFQFAYDNIDGHRILVKQTPVAGIMDFDVFAYPAAQMTAIGVVTGITHYEILIDNKVFQTVYVNAQSLVAAFQHYGLAINTVELTNGSHELAVIAYDEMGRPSVFDISGSSIAHGEYIPVVFTCTNPNAPICTPAYTDNDLGNGGNIAMNSYRALGNISSSGTVELGNTVTFDAGNQVILNSGFQVETGGSFIVKTDGCQ